MYQERKRIAALRELNRQILLLIKTGEIEKARELLAQIEIIDRPTQRMKAHLEGKIQLVLHNYDAAIEIFQNALHGFGTHVILQADLAAAYYLTRRYGLWKVTLDSLVLEFESCEALLDESLAERLRILIAKFLEEAADICGAQKVLQGTLKSVDPVTRQKVQTHLLRLEVQYRLQHRLLDSYTQLKQASPATENKEYLFELYHSLAIVEAELSSPELAYESLSHLAQVDPISKSLIMFDLAEIEFRQKGSVSPEIKNIIATVEPSHFYEEKLLEIMNGAVSLDWYRWSSEMPLGNYLRLMSLLLAAPWFKEKDLARHQWKLITGGLSKKNQNAWNSLLASQNPEIPEVTVSITGPQEIKVNHVTIDLSRKPLLLDLTRILKKYQTLTQEQLCQELWSVEWSESYSARLRQLALRLNKLTLKNASVEICSYRQGQFQLLG